MRFPPAAAIDATFDSVVADESAELTGPRVLKPHRRILELDGLRALAAISLMLFHLTHVYAAKYGFTTELPWVYNYGAYGTEMFFILSGFVNSMSLLRRRRPVDFVVARLIRIVPIFLLVVLANVAIVRLAPMNHSVAPEELIANLTLLPRIAGYECLDPVMWTLQVEMLFYATLLGLYLIGGLRRYFIGWGALLMLSVTVCPALDAWQTVHGETVWFGIATGIRRLMLLDFVPLFAIGFGLYMIKTKTGNRLTNLAGISVAATVFHLIDHGKHNPAATALIIAGVALAAYGKCPPLRIRPLIHISKISYALYLLHNNLGCALIHHLDHGGIPPVIAVSAAIAMAWALAVLVTTHIEAPLTKWLRTRWETHRRSAQTA